MAMAYAKLFSSIVHSTVWREEMHVKVVWITMIALANRHGDVQASMPGLADAAKVSFIQCEDALARLSSADPYSRTKDYEGRRIAETDGGWLILNYAKHRAVVDQDERREKTRLRVAKHRAGKRAGNASNAKYANETITAKPAPAPEATPTPEADTITSTKTDTTTVVLAKFTEVFNASYSRRLKIPNLNGKASKQLNGLVKAYGPDGTCCLAILGYIHDASASNPASRIKDRAISDLFHDGTDGTYEWSKLLQTAGSLPAPQAARALEIAEKVGLSQALREVGVQ